MSKSWQISVKWKIERPHNGIPSPLVCALFPCSKGWRILSRQTKTVPVDGGYLIHGRTTGGANTGTRGHGCEIDFRYAFQTETSITGYS